MPERTLIKELRTRVGKQVIIKGFVETLRNQKVMQFLVLRDHTGLAQVVNSKADNEEYAEVISSLTVESAVIIVGKVAEAPNVKLGGIEVQLESIEVANMAAAIPIDEQSSLESRMDHRHVSLRFPSSQLIMRVQTTMEWAMRKYWHQNDFIEIHSPKLMGVASESGSELFELPYFGGKAYLAQSPQFYKQMAIAGGLDRVFEIGPVFRANPSRTSRHDTEFTSIDMEIAWVDSHEDVMKLEEDWLSYVVGEIAKEHGEEIERQFNVQVIVPQIPFPRITLSEARELLAQRGHLITDKADLDPEGERMLSAIIAERYGHEFVFVTDYPAEVRAFYHMRYEGTNITKSFDLLWKGLEITTGAQREHRPEILTKQAKERGLSLRPLESYFGFFEQGCPPHGGCGVGLTRLLMTIMGAKNVREVTFMYRGLNRLTP